MARGNEKRKDLLWLGSKATMLNAEQVVFALLRIPMRIVISADPPMVPGKLSASSTLFTVLFSGGGYLIKYEVSLGQFAFPFQKTSYPNAPATVTLIWAANDWSDLVRVVPGYHIVWFCSFYELERKNKGYEREENHSRPTLLHPGKVHPRRHHKEL